MFNRDAKPMQGMSRQPITNESPADVCFDAVPRQQSRPVGNSGVSEMSPDASHSAGKNDSGFGTSGDTLSRTSPSSRSRTPHRTRPCSHRSSRAARSTVQNRFSAAPAAAPGTAVARHPGRHLDRRFGPKMCFRASLGRPIQSRTPALKQRFGGVRRQLGLNRSGASRPTCAATTPFAPHVAAQAAILAAQVNA